MKCQFVKDHNGTIWFFHASNIWVRPNMEAQKASEEQEARVKKINEQTRKHYLKMMEEARRIRNEKGSTLNQNIKALMT